MTNAQKWVAAFLFLFVVLFALSRFTNTFEPEPENLNYNYQAEATEPDGLTLITNAGCLSCHGENFEGTNLGPALVKLDQYWSRDDLINYLRSPSDFASGDRFRDYKKKFNKVVMPSYKQIDVKDLGKMVDYLLKNAGQK